MKLAEGLPGSLRRAVELDRVPNDLKPDLLFLAQLLDPIVEKAKAVAPSLPEKAHQAVERIDREEEQAFEVRLPSVETPQNDPHALSKGLLP